MSAQGQRIQISTLFRKATRKNLQIKTGKMSSFEYKVLHVGHFRFLPARLSNKACEVRDTRQYCVRGTRTTFMICTNKPVSKTCARILSKKPGEEVRIHVIPHKHTHTQKPTMTQSFHLCLYTGHLRASSMASSRIVSNPEVPEAAVEGRVGL